MRSFLALYRGRSIGSAQLVAVTANPDIVTRFADELLRQTHDWPTDPVIAELRNGGRRALEVVRDETGGRAMSVDGR